MDKQIDDVASQLRQSTRQLIHLMQQLTGEICGHQVLWVDFVHMAIAFCAFKIGFTRALLVHHMQDLIFKYQVTT